MSNRLKRKAAVMIAVELAFLALLGVLLTNMQIDFSLADQRESITEKLGEMEGLLQAADASGVEIAAEFDEENRAKAGSVAFMYQNGVLTGYTRANMQLVRDLLEVDNVLILDDSGRVLAQAGSSPATFTRSRYNQLRTVFDSGEPSEAFEVVNGDVCYRYYGARIDETTMAVVEKNAETLDERLTSSATLASALDNVSVGLDGFSFAISARDYTFQYYPDEAVIGQDAISAGVSVAGLEEGAFNWFTIGGQKLYCGVTRVDDTYILCAIPAEEIYASSNTTAIVILFAVFAVLTLVITYAFFIIGDKSRQEVVKQLPGKLCFSVTVARRIGSVSVIGLVVILIVSFYMQTIYSLSRQSMGNSQRLMEVEQHIAQYEAESAELAAEYDALYLNKARIAAHIIDANPALANRDSLAELSEILALESVNVFDQSGVQIATNSPYTRFTVSDDPEDQSYEFNKLLLGVDSLVQKAQPDDVSGEFHQYIGVTLRDDEGNPNGFVQISVIPSRLEATETSLEIGNILSGIRMGSGGVVFAVSMADGTIAYHPSQRYIGRDALEYGLTDAQLADGYTGYISFASRQYFASTLETDEYIVFAAVPTSASGSARLPVTLAATGASLLALLIVILMLCTFRNTPSKAKKPEKEKKQYGAAMVDVIMPDGSIKKTESVTSRWRNSFIQWQEKTPEQKVLTVMRGLLGVLAVLICLAIALRDQIFESNSVFLFVLDGQWARGLNIFAVTASLLIICVTVVVAMIAQKILTVMARTFGAKGETVCRLLKSLVKYISVIVMLYYCLALLGIDTATLLASAGILTLIVGLGAQTLVSDILAGLFIIFEGEFQVGDIVTVGDWTGTVVEIGVRTTKIQDGNKNVKVISNSNVSGVINKTRDYSFSSVDIGIEYSESLERVENILEKEFPNIRAHLPNIIDGPFYKGVVALADNSVILRVVVMCAEGDRAQMERDLNRELKLIFDKYSIDIPFPQIVVNRPTVAKKATESEKAQARRFTEAQRELSENIMPEDEEDRDL